MACPQWELVLIDWVNCLKLCKPVNTLDELRNGEFFKHLRKLISKKTTAPIPDDDLTVIFNLLSQHYPGVKFLEEDSVHLKDMHPIDLVNLTSLMMHYTCIYDRRNALTSPMCYSLNLTTQLYIKVFLELISNETTNNDLAAVIQEVCTENSTLLGTPVMRNQSPLQSLLKTPALKNVKLIEKNREIERLKLELESEKADRNDCEFELAHFKEKVAILEGHLKQKNSEIKRLRMDEENLKIGTPPEFQDAPARESHKLLHKEIENLEEYVRKCEQEQDALQKDKDTLKERTRKLENSCTMWQQNFYEIEEKYQSTVEQLREFELKNDTLEEHCSELQALLSEFQGKKSLDDSMQLEIRRNRRSRGFECSLNEDLAHSVVDMQLKEAQKTIEELTQKLEQTQEEKISLQNQLLSAVEEKNQLASDFKGAQINVADLQKALTNKSEECDSLRDQTSALDSKIQRLELRSTQQEEANRQQQEELATLAQNLQLSKSQCDSLRSDLEQQLVQEKQTIQQLREVKNDNQNLSMQVSKLTTDLHNRCEELSKYTAMLEDSTANIQQLNTELLQLQQCKQELNKQTAELQQVVTNKSSECDRLTVRLSVVEAEVDSLKLSLQASTQLVDEQRKELTLNLQLSKSLNDQLESKLVELEQTQTDNQNLNAQITKLTSDFEEKCQKLSQVSLELSTSSVKVQQLEAELLTVNAELTLQTAEVAKLQQLFGDKSTECDSLKVALELSNRQETASKQVIDQQKEELATLSQNLVTFKLQLEEAYNEKRNLDLQVSNLTADLVCGKTNYENLQSELKQFEERFEEVSDSRLKLSQQIVDKDEDLKSAKSECENLRNELEKHKEDSEVVVNALKLDNVRFREISESKTALLLQAEEKLKEEQQKCSKLDQYGAELSKKLEESNARVQQLDADLTDQLEKLQQLIEQSNQQEAVSRQLVNHQQEELAALSRNLELSKSLNDQLKQENEEQLEKLQQLIFTKSTECDSLTAQRAALEAEIDSLKCSLEQSNQQEVVSRQLVNHQQEELAALTRNLELSKSLNDQLKQENGEQLEKLQQLIFVKSTECDSLTAQTASLEAEIDSLKCSLEKSNQQEAVSRQLVNHQQEELAALSRNLELSKSLNDQLKQENGEQLKKLQQLISTKSTECDSLTAQTAALEAEIDSLKCSLEQSNQQEAVSRQLVNHQQEELAALSCLSKSMYDELKQENERLRGIESELEEAQIDNQNLNARLSKLTANLDEKCCQLIQLETELKEQASQVEQLHQVVFDKSAGLTALELENDSLKQQETANRQLVKQLQEDQAMLSSNLEQSKSLGEQLNERLLQTKLQLEEAENDKRNLESKMSQVTTELEGVKEQYQEALSVNGEDHLKLSTQLALKEERCKNLEGTIQELTLDKEVVNSELKEALQDLEESKTELQSVVKQLEVATLTLNKTQEDVKTLKFEKESINFYLKDTSKQLDEAEEKLEEAQNRLKKAKVEKSKLQKRVVELETQLREMEHSKHPVQNNLDEALLKLEVLEKNLTQVKSEKNHFARLVEQLEDQLVKLEKIEGERDETLSQLEQTRKDLDKSQEATRVVQNFLDLNTNELSIVIQEKEQLLEALEMSNKDKLDLEEENKSYSVELEKLRQELQLKDCELAESSLKLEQVNKEKNHIHKELEEKLKLKESELELGKLEKLDIVKNLEKLHREKEEKQTQSSEEKNKLLQDKLEILENLQKVIKEKEKLFFELGNISSQLEATKKENRAIMSDYQDLQSEIKKLEVVRQQHQELASRLETAQKEHKDMENELKKLQLEKEDVIKEKNDLYDYLQRCVEDKERTTLEKDRLQGECDELKRERDSMFQRLQSTAEECQKMALSLELSEKETAKVKKERNEILKSQTEVMKETEHRIMLAHEVAVEEKRELLNCVEVTEKERDKLRTAYANAMAANSKLDLENSTLRKRLEERKHDLSQASNLKEAYEKLLEDNCRYSKEIEVLKQKRSRDREEFLTLLKKEQEKGKKVEQVRAEYEDKLDKMKERMLKLYREEVQKEMDKVKNDQAGEVAYLQKVNDDLRNELWEMEKKVKTLQTAHFSSRESIHSNPDQKLVKHMGTSSLRGRSNKVADRNSLMAASCNSLVSRQAYSLSKEMVETLPKVRSTSHLCGREGKLSTLPHKLKPGDYVEETVTVSRRTSINSLGRNFEMEDEEDDMFNNKYLTDLKEGRCLLPSAGRESNANRVSELAWRNSMVPPHLKSSYPAELQFVSPTRFNEEDIKAGNVMDDSQCKLLPGEKQRAPKKDFGTTSYKKPGPPTPSKNGGRLSLQGGDVLPLREQNGGGRASTTPKKSTPSKLRALFKGMRDGGAHQRENVENLTPRESRRFSLWNRK